jgi:hypothetical protein
VLDRFSENGVQRRMAELADEQLETCTIQFEDIHFVTVSVDSATVHWLNEIHCLVSNRFVLIGPV